MGLIRLWLNSKQWANEDTQMELALLLLSAAKTGKVEFHNAMLMLIFKNGWKKGEAGDRVIHACRMAQALGGPAHSHEISRIAKDLYMSIREAW